MFLGDTGPGNEEKIMCFTTQKSKKNPMATKHFCGFPKYLTKNLHFLHYFIIFTIISGLFNLFVLLCW